jgi:hypothetical protein
VNHLIHLFVLPNTEEGLSLKDFNETSVSIQQGRPRLQCGINLKQNAELADVRFRALASAAETQQAVNARLRLMKSSPCSTRDGAWRHSPVVVRAAAGQRKNIAA